MPASTQTVFCPADGLIDGQIMAHFYYQNMTSDPRFMEFDVLSESFYDALRSSLPLALATDMQTGPLWSGGLTAMLSSNPGRPPMTRHVDSKCTIANMIAEGFSRASQPLALDSMPHLRKPLEGDALVTLDVVYMADGVGVGVAFSHAVVDMGACVRFCQEWGARAQSMYSPDDSVVYQPAVLNIDRARFWDAITAEETRAESAFDKHLAELADTAPELGNDGPSKVEPDMGGGAKSLYRIEITAAATGGIGEARKNVAPGASIPNFLSAVLWRAVTRANPEAHHTYFATSLTVRTDPRFAEFWGNTSTMKYIHMDAGTFSAMDIGDIARTVQAIMSEFTPAEYLRILGTFTNTEYIRNLVRHVLNGHAPVVAISNVSRVPMYSVDFGFGPPAKVICPTALTPGMVVLFPNSMAGGIDIYLRASDAEIEQIAGDSLLKDHISVRAYEP
ncbi:hypothetical protein IWQ57_002062 [Coemansia nantahalensis]|uniref:Uncharacterized protein n=1 Tax=Coemansia nantahalensis TaxID=2789366 RepID=A0ACC1K1N7_9FUNG|nr:hypothetical protein IWQ57_002062 [Coemansia nantahalensis]